jgi:hypothetical protein
MGDKAKEVEKKQRQSKDKFSATYSSSYSFSLGYFQSFQLYILILKIVTFYGYLQKFIFVFL